MKHAETDKRNCLHYYATIVQKARLHSQLGTENQFSMRQFGEKAGPNRLFAYAIPDKKPTRRTIGKQCTWEHSAKDNNRERNVLMFVKERKKEPIRTRKKG